MNFFNRYYIFVITDLLLILIKPYSLLIVLPLTIITLLNNKKVLLQYLTLLLIFTSLIIIIKKNLAYQKENIFNIFGPQTLIDKDYFINLFNLVFSINFGLFFIPFIFLLIIYTTFNKVQKIRDEFFITVLLLMLLGMFLSMYEFWHGATGVAGQRYIAPFLVLLLMPLAKVVERTFKNLFLNIIFAFIVIININTINFRNTMVDHYSSSYSLQIFKETLHHKNFPYWDISFYPAIFANRLSFYYYYNNNVIMKSSYINSKFIKVSDVIPMSGISRISWSLKSSSNDERVLKIKNLFSHSSAFIFFRTIELIFFLLIIKIIIYIFFFKKN
jgi:hypothetical protein